MAHVPTSSHLREDSLNAAATELPADREEYFDIASLDHNASDEDVIQAITAAGFNGGDAETIASLRQYLDEQTALLNQHLAELQTSSTPPLVIEIEKKPTPPSTPSPTVHRTTPSVVAQEEEDAAYPGLWRCIISAYRRGLAQGRASEYMGDARSASPSVDGSRR
jgi:hypothetical protein